MMLHCMSSDVALLRHADGFRRCPLSGKTGSAQRTAKTTLLMLWTAPLCGIEVP